MEKGAMIDSLSDLISFYIRGKKKTGMKAEV